MAVDKSLVSGSTMMLLLKLLSEKDMYGYEMIETLRERSQNVFELKAGTLYPLLHTMEEKGMLEVYEREAGGKIRKYYSITKQGRKVLRERQEDWNTYARAVRAVLGFRQEGKHEERGVSGNTDGTDPLQNGTWSSGRGNTLAY